MSEIFSKHLLANPQQLGNSTISDYPSNPTSSENLEIPQSEISFPKQESTQRSTSLDGDTAQEKERKVFLKHTISLFIKVPSPSGIIPANACSPHYC